MKRYEQYKDSGVAWIGEIPAHWETVKPKYTMFLQKGTKPQELTDEDNGNLPYLTMDVLRDRTNKTTMYPTSVNDLVKVGNGDILVLWDGANAGEVLLAKDGYLSSTMARFGFDTNKLDSRYWFYFLKGLEPILKEFAGGTTIPHLDSSKIMEEAYPIPSMEEQQAIVRYLDYKVAKIDKLIAENEAQVKELEKYRTAVISEVVTKGLNPNAPMRDSGIQWIGEIPAHWDIFKLKYALDGICDGTHGSYSRIEHGFPLLSAKNISDNGIIMQESESCISEEDFLSITSNGFPKYGDILFSCVGTIGRCCLFIDDNPMAFQRSVAFLRTNKKVNNTYLLCLLKSRIMQVQYDLFEKKSAQGGIYMGVIKDMMIVVPPLQEQHLITDYIEHRCRKYNLVIEKLSEQIEELKAYKIALISEAVTGQIDVRDWQEK